MESLAGQLGIADASVLNLYAQRSQASYEHWDYGFMVRVPTYDTNGLIRQYFPKGTNLNLHGPERLAEVAAKINARPRESRNWEPAQTHFYRLTETVNI